MGDHNGGAGRGAARGSVPQNTVGNVSPVGGAAASPYPENMMRETPSLNADAQLRLRYADRLNNARNPGRRRVLSTSAGLAEAAWVRAYRTGYDNRQFNENFRNGNEAFVRTYAQGYAQGQRDRFNQITQDRRGYAVPGATLGTRLQQ